MRDKEIKRLRTALALTRAGVSPEEGAAAFARALSAFPSALYESAVFTAPAGGVNHMFSRPEFKTGEDGVLRLTWVMTSGDSASVYPNGGISPEEEKYIESLAAENIACWVEAKSLRDAAENERRRRAERNVQVTRAREAERMEDEI